MSDSWKISSTSRSEQWAPRSFIAPCSSPYSTVPLWFRSMASNTRRVFLKAFRIAGNFRITRLKCRLLRGRRRRRVTSQRQRLRAATHRCCLITPLPPVSLDADQDFRFWSSPRASITLEPGGKRRRSRCALVSRHQVLPGRRARSDPDAGRDCGQSAQERTGARWRCSPHAAAAAFHSHTPFRPSRPSAPPTMEERGEPAQARIRPLSCGRCCNGVCPCDNGTSVVCFVGFRPTSLT